MTTILYISASAREYYQGQEQHSSISRMLGETFLTSYAEKDEQVQVIRRDLSVNVPSFIDREFIAAAFAKDEKTPQEQAALRESDELIDEIEKADLIIISSPMYNYGMPAVLKAWFDKVIRVNRTFSFDLARGDTPLLPMLSGKSVVLLSSWGEFDFKKGQAKQNYNHLSSHVEQLSPYLGADVFYEVSSEYEEFGDQRHTDSKQRAIQQTKILAQKMATTTFDVCI